MTNRRVLENQALDIHYGGVHDLFYFISFFNDFISFFTDSTRYLKLRTVKRD